jgi:hypothetical protein
MEQAARALPLPVVNDGYALNPKLITRTKGNGRAIAVAKLRELADRLESGELDGVRCQWLDTHGENREDDGTPVSGLEFVTRTAWTETGEGTVQLVGLTIEEERV